MKKLRVLELFGGIGACSKALERLKIEYEIADYVEIDKYAVKSFNAIHGTNFETQDICEWNKDIEVDLIMHGSPCQDFSLAGKQAGGDKDSGTRSSLMYETIRIVEKLKPKYVIWENVKNVVSKKHKHNYDNYCNKMTELGYRNYGQILNAKDYGIPQNRERVFTISIRKDIDKIFKFPPKQELKLKLRDILEPKVDEKYYLSDKMIRYISATGTANFRNPNSKINLDIARPITTDQNKRAGTTNYLSNDLPDNYNLEEVNRLYGIFDNKSQKHQAGSVYDLNGLSPTLDTMQGGNKQPFIEKKNKIINVGNVNPSGRGQNGTVIDSEGLARTITIEKGEGQKILIKNNTKQGYLEATEEPKIIDDRDIGLNGVNITNICPTQRASRNGLKVLQKDLRIRKLTPKESWRLMGFDDSDFEKAEKVNSNTQLYKQAGNSIVVNVLEEILKELL